MGQKVHPTGFRLGFNKTWNSIWWASCNYNGYTHLLKEDFKIHDYIRGTLASSRVTSHLPKIYRKCGNIYILLNFNFIKIKKKKRRYRSRLRNLFKFQQKLKKKGVFKGLNKKNIPVLPKSFNLNLESPWNKKKHMGKQITSSFFLKKKKSSKFIKKYPVKQHKTPLNLKKRITRLKEFKKFKFKNLLKKSNIFNKLYQLHKSYKFISKFIKSPFHLKKKINQLKINNKKKKKIKFFNFLYKIKKKNLKSILKKFKKLNKYFYLPKKRIETLRILRKLNLLKIKYRNLKLKLNKFQLKILNIRSKKFIFNKLKLLKFKLNQLKKKLKQLKKLNGLKNLKKKLIVILNKLKIFAVNVEKFRFKKLPSTSLKNMNKFQDESIKTPNYNMEFLQIKKLREGFHKKNSQKLKKFHQKIILKKKQKLLTVPSFIFKKKKFHQKFFKIKSNLELITNSNIKILIRPARKKHNIAYNPSYLAKHLANTLKNPQNKRKFVFLYYQLYRNLKSITLQLKERQNKTKKIKGFRIKYAGKLWSKGRSKKRLVYHGPVSLQNINEMLDYHFIKVITKYGVTGFKIWFNYYPRANHVNIGKKSIIHYEPYLYLLNHKKKLYYVDLLLLYYKNNLMKKLLKRKI